MQFACRHARNRIVKITLLPSAISESGIVPNQYLTTLLVNDRIAIDGGSLGLYRSPRDQAAIQHMFVSHTHLDHWATLPIFLVNVFDMAPTPPTLYASEVVLDMLRRDVFNGRVWPNFLEMSHEGRPFVKIQVIESGKTLDVEGLRITPVAVNHAVPTLGFILEDAASAVVIASDTAATTEIWQRADRLSNLKAVFLEATLPNNLSELAGVTKHLTPNGLVGEMRKLTRPPTFYAVHLSARNRDEVIRELQAHRLSNLQIAEFGKTYEF
jgi:ribonuclease BN (tRNA processing enzyme)